VHLLARYLEPVSAASLGIARFLFYAYLFGRLWSHDFGLWSDAPSALWNPHLSFRSLGLGPPGAIFGLLGIVFKLSVLTSCLGLFTRLSTMASAVLGFYLFGAEACFGMMSHDHSVVVLALLVLACSRCGDAFSMDAKLKPSGLAPSHKHLAYAWPPFLIQVLMCNMLFWAGVSKFTAAGLGWGTAEQFRSLILSQSLVCSDGVPFQGGLWILEHTPWVLALMGPATMILELLMPLALIPKLRGAFGAVALLFFVLIRCTLGPNFLTMIGLILFWVPWDRFLEKKERATQRGFLLPSVATNLQTESGRS
jgi:hypothetical protein